MVLEDFLVMLGAETETEKVKSFGAALTKVASIATVVVGALKTVTAAAWAFADSYVRKAEELYKSNSGLISVTKEQVEMSKKYQDGMKKLGDNIESVKVRIAFGFLPTMLKMVDSLNSFLAANKDLIVNGITRLLNIISYASQVVNNTVRFITKAIEATIGWKAALLILAGVFAFVKRAMLMAFITNPITWVVAAIVGLMLLIDDFMTYLDGSESLFGDYWGAMLEWINKAKKAWNDFSEEAKSSIKAVAVALGMLAASPAIIKVMTVAFTVLGSAVKLIMSPILGLIKTVTMLGKAFLIAGKFMIANPMVLVAAIIAGIAYAIYDLIKWIRTGESAFGGLWESVANGFNIIVSVVSAVMAAIIAAFFNGLSVVGGAFTSAVDGIASMWATMVDSISTAFSAFIAFFSSIIATLVTIASATWDSIVSAIQERINSIIAAIQSFISTLGSALSGVFDVVTAPFARAFDWISNKFSSLGGLISGAVSGIGKMAGMGASAAASSTVNNGGNMTVHAPINVVSSDPNKAAKLVKTGVTDTMNTAHRNMGSRVKA